MIKKIIISIFHKVSSNHSINSQKYIYFMGDKTKHQENFTEENYYE